MKKLGLILLLVLLSLAIVKYETHKSEPLNGITAGEYDANIDEVTGDQRDPNVYVGMTIISPGPMLGRHTSCTMSNSEYSRRELSPASSVRVSVDNEGFARIE